MQGERKPNHHGDRVRSRAAMTKARSTEKTTKATPIETGTIYRTLFTGGETTRFPVCYGTRGRIRKTGTTPAEARRNVRYEEFKQGRWSAA
jgi:hypothetical protein